MLRPSGLHLLMHCCCCRYGLVYAGIGWVMWREPKDVPEDLVFHINYLGTGGTGLRVLRFQNRV